MGIKDFFKKIFSEDSAKGTAEPVEKRSISELGEFENILGEKAAGLKEEKDKILLGLKDKIKIFISEATEELSRLKKIDLDKRREDQRLKNIVVENFNIYLKHLDKLLDDLRDLDFDNLEEYLDGVNSLFFKFDSNSGMNFEKATVLFGQDMKSAKQKISNLLSELKAIKSENKSVFDRDELVKNIKELISEFKSLGNSEIKTNEVLVHLEKEIKKVKKEIEDLEVKIDDIKSSDEYKREIKLKEEIEDEKNELNKNVYAIKQKIDFKDLSSKFHGIDKEFNMIKKYSDNFLNSLVLDEDLVILELVGDGNVSLAEDIRNLRDKILELNEEKKFEMHEKVKDLERELGNFKVVLKDKEKETEFENKKIEKFALRKKEIISDIKHNSKSILSDIELNL